MRTPFCCLELPRRNLEYSLYFAPNHMIRSNRQRVVMVALPRVKGATMDHDEALTKCDADFLAMYSLRSTIVA